MNFRLFLIPLILIGTPKLTFATSLPAINDFILAAQADLNDVNATRKGIPELNGLSSWIEEAQLRFNEANETDSGTDVNLQTYALRVKPKAWGQRDAEQKILRLRSTQEDEQYNQTLNAELSRRYGLILDLIDQEHQTRFLLDSDALLNKQVQLNRNLVNSSDFNEENLLDVEIAFEQTKDTFDLNLHRLNDLQKQLKIPEDNRESLMASDNALQWLITVPQMQKIMDQHVEPQQLPDVIKSHLQLEQAKAENQHNKSKQQLGINLLRLQVDDSSNSNKSPKFGFMVGVNIPLGAENFQTTEGRHDIVDARLKVHDSMYTTTQDLAEKRTKMKWLEEEWLFTQKQMDKLKERMQKDYAKINPQLGLTLQIEYAKKLKEALDIQQEALALYISYLTLSGQMARSPLRNWLHTELPELRPVASKRPIPNQSTHG